MNENVKIIFETLGASEAAAGLEKTGGAASEAEGKIGKLGAVATVAGVAMVGAAAESIKHYEEMTTKVGQLSDATGLSTDAASRWTDVAEHAGVSSDTLETGIGKLEKALGKNKDAFDQYGVSVVHAKDGTIDANGTFLNAIDALNKIQDPAQRAAAGAAMFGRGWQGMAELVGQGSDKLRHDLAAVDPAKVFSDADVNAGRGLREAFKQISDAGEELEITLARALAPAVIQIATELSKLIKAAEPLVSLIGSGLVGALQGVEPAFDAAAKAAEALSKGLDDIGIHGQSATTIAQGLTQGAMGVAENAGSASKALGGMAEKALASGDAMAYLIQHGFTESGALRILDDYNTKMEKAAAADNITSDATEHMGVTMQDTAARTDHLTESLVHVDRSEQDYQQTTAATAKTTAQLATDTANATAAVQAFLDTLNQDDALKNAASDVYAYNLKMLDAKASTDEQSAALETAQKSLATLLGSLKDMPPTQTTKILAEIQSGDLAEADREITDFINKSRPSITLSAVVGKIGGPHFASGTNSAPGGAALVGEEGPEWVDLPAGSKVHTAAQTRSMLGGSSSGGGGTVIVNTQLSERRVMALLNGAQRRGVRNPWG